MVHFLLYTNYWLMWTHMTFRTCSKCQCLLVPSTDPVTFVDYYKADYEPRAGSMNPDEYKFYFVFLQENILVQNNVPDVLIPDDVSAYYYVTSHKENEETYRDRTSKMQPYKGGTTPQYFYGFPSLYLLTFH